MEEHRPQLTDWMTHGGESEGLALFERIRASGERSLLNEFADGLEQRAPQAVRLLQAVGQALLEAGELERAQALLVAAGRGGAPDPAVFRLLGIVLLRRGDAERARRSLDRAAHLGDAEAADWLARAALYVTLQRHQGAAAVAAAVADELDEAMRGRRESLPSESPPRLAASDSAVAAPVTSRSGGGAGIIQVDVPIVSATAPSVSSDRLSVYPRLRTGAPPVLVENPLHRWRRMGLWGPVDALPWQKSVRQRASLALVVLSLSSTALVVGAVVWGYLSLPRVASQRVAAVEQLRDQLPTASGADLKALSLRADDLWRRYGDLPEVLSLVLEVRVLSSLFVDDPPSLAPPLVVASRIGADADLREATQLASFLRSSASEMPLAPRSGPHPASHPLWHLVAAVAGERRGRGGVEANYELAARRYPVASALRARYLLSTGATRTGEDQQRWPRDAAVLINGLSWALRPPGATGAAPPIPPQDPALIRPLRSLVPLIIAMKRVESGEPMSARGPLADALSAEDSPWMVRRIGQLALRIGDVGLARRAAQRLELLGSDFSPGKWFAVRVALEMGDVPTARSLATKLESGHAEGALLRAMIAYEELDRPSLDRELQWLERSAPASLEFRAAQAARRVLSGGGDPRVLGPLLIGSSIPWGEQVLADAWLQAGALPEAEALVAGWTRRGALTPPCQLRAERWHRLGVSGAVDLPPRAGEGPRGRFEAQLQALVSRRSFPAVTATEAVEPWTRALALLVDGPLRDGMVAVAELQLPSGELSWEERLLVAWALTLARDPRSYLVLRDLAEARPRSPEIQEISRRR